MKPSDEMQRGEVVVYKSPDGQVRVDVHVEQETVWPTQTQIAKLFSTTAQNITLHLKTIYADGELEEGATCKDYLQVRREGALAQTATCARYAQVRTEGGRTVTREVDHYNLDVIISVGYRVKSPRGTLPRREGAST